MFAQALMMAAAAAALHIAPARSGSGDGSSWENAGQLSDLADFARRAGGRPIWLRADQGSYQTQPIQVAVGGKDRAPLTITGVDAAGKPAKAELVGTRTAPYSLQGDPGGEVFRLGRGADHVRLQNLSFRNEGLAVRVTGDLRDLTIENVDAHNVRRFFDTQASGKGATASVDGLVLRQVEIAGYSKAAIRLRNDTRKVLIEDVVGDSQGQDGDKFAMGVHLTDTVHDVTLRRVTMKNSRDSTGGYWNGDGFASERGTYDIRFEDTLAAGNSDGGYDLKTRNVTMTRAVAEDNKRNFRLWQGGTLTDVVSRDPVKRGGVGGAAHFWFGGGGGPDERYVLRRPTITGKEAAAAFAFESKAPVSLEVDDPKASAETLKRISAPEAAPQPDIEINPAGKREGR
jgi:hypothetical protein